MSRCTFLLSFRGGTPLEFNVEADSLALNLLREVVCACETQLKASADIQTAQIIVKGKKPLTYAAATTSTTVGSWFGVSAPDGVLRGVVLCTEAARIDELRHLREDRTVVGFDEEMERHARRLRASLQSQPGPSADSSGYGFGAFELWRRPGLSPALDKAEALLHRVAADPGIAHLMRTHRWHVPVLREMPPEGLVGVSPVCVLGVNINRGQQIALRLRTDDLRGFRKFESVRQVMVHELAHMVFSDHDDDFKAFNSQLLREAGRFWGGGASAGGASGTMSAEEALRAVEAQLAMIRRERERGGGGRAGGRDGVAAGSAMQTRDGNGHPEQRAQEGLGDRADNASNRAEPGLNGTSGSNAGPSPAQSGDSEGGVDAGVASGGEAGGEDWHMSDVLATGRGDADNGVGGDGTVNNWRDACVFGAWEIDGGVAEADAAVMKATELRGLADRVVRAASSPAEATAAFQLLLSIVRNVASNPFDLQKRQLRQSNARLQAAAGRLDGAMAFLSAVGFTHADRPLVPPRGQAGAATQAVGGVTGTGASGGGNSHAEGSAGWLVMGGVDAGVLHMAAELLEEAVRRVERACS